MTFEENIFYELHLVWVSLLSNKLECLKYQLKPSLIFLGMERSSIQSIAIIRPGAYTINISDS
jgi:hypothetical protein